MKKKSNEIVEDLLCAVKKITNETIDNIREKIGSDIKRDFLDLQYSKDEKDKELLDVLVVLLQFFNEVGAEINAKELFKWHLWNVVKVKHALYLKDAHHDR